MTEPRPLSMLWRLSWRSPEACHTDEYFVPLNKDQEAHLLPRPLQEALGDWQEGLQVTLESGPGEILPAYAPERVFSFTLGQFKGGPLQPRRGRYYPRGLLDGHYGNPLPFRCISLSGQSFQADFNHPFAAFGFLLTVTGTHPEPVAPSVGSRSLDWFDVVTSGPGMQVRWQGQPTDFFADNPFGRRDISDDAGFYAEPRLVAYVDHQAQAVIQGLYGRLLRPGMAVLDLMSGWQSHLPADFTPATLTGLGLNEAELQANPQLSGYVLHDLNRDPRLPFADASFDAVICSLSVEYLIRPFQVFADCARVLRPGGLLIHTFSDRWEPLKIIRIWTELSEFERQGLVLEYFLKDGLFTDLETFSSRGWPRPDAPPSSRLVQADPVFAVWGRRRR